MADPATPQHRVGDFALVEFIGRGGMGIVWRARHVPTGTSAAIKLISSDFWHQAGFWARFLQEVQAMAMLEHPSIVTVYDYGEVEPHEAGGPLEAGMPYVALEHADAGTLWDWLDDGLDWPMLRGVLLSLLDALAHAHARGLIHRDLKPDNVLAFSGAAVRRWKLTDFGIVHFLDGERTDGEDLLFGTPHYMAPEQFACEWRELGPWTDLYALGCLAYQLACGKLPYDADSAMGLGACHATGAIPRLEATVPVPKGFDEWVRTLMAKAPAERYQRAADAAWALRRLGEPSGLEVSRRLYPAPEIPHDAPTLHAAPALPTLGPTLGLSGDELDELRDSQSMPAFSREAVEAGRDLPPVPPRYPGDAFTQWQSLAAQSPRLFGLREVPLVGRHDEREALWGALRRLHDEPAPGLVVVAGPAGCGKSRLARWLAERGEEIGATVTLKAVHEPGRSGGETLADMVRRHLRCEGLDAAACAERIDHHVPGLDRWVADRLVAMLTGTQAAEADAKAEAEDRRAIVHLLGAMARRRPVLVWLDDVQWSESALDLIEAVLNETDLVDCPVLFVATAQSEALAERPSVQAQLEALVERADAMRMDVEPLTDAEAVALVDALLDLDPALSGRIVERVAGNPLFAVQLVGDWVERGWLERVDGRYQLCRGVEPELPDDLFGVWSDRLDRLFAGRGTDARRAVELAAVLGREVDQVEWRTACARARIAPAERLVDCMVDLRLARRSETGWAFIHGMLREALLRRIRGGDAWRAHHATAAAALEAVAKLTPAPQLQARLGEHLLRAGRPDQALDPLLDGARALIDRGMYAAAGEALDLYVEALDALPDDPRARLRGQLMRAKVLTRLYDTDAAAELCQTVGEEAGRLGMDDLRARALLWRCFNSHRAGEMSGAARDAEQALEIFERLGDDAGIVEARLRLGDHGTYTGDNVSAVAHFQAGLERAEQIGDERSAAWCHYGMGYALQQLGRLEAARDHLTESIARYTAIADEVTAHTARCTLGDVERSFGHWARAEQIYLEVRDFFASRRMNSAPLDANLALLNLDRGDLGQARRWTLELERTLERQRRSWDIVDGLKAIFAAVDADAERFDAHFERYASAIAESGQADLDRALIVLWTAERAEARGYVGRARRAYAIARKMFASLDDAQRLEAVETRLEALKD